MSGSFFKFPFDSKGVSSFLTVTIKSLKLYLFYFSMKHHLFFSFFKGALAIMQLFLFTTLGSQKLFLVTEHIVRSYLRMHSVSEFVAEHQYDMLRRQVPSINDVKGHSKTTLTIYSPLSAQLFP
jgi:hypothetical protein